MYSKEEKRLIFKVISSNKHYGIKTLCNYFGVSRSGFYDFMDRGASYKNNYQLNRDDVIELAVEISKKYPSKGYRRINRSEFFPQ